MRLDAIVLVRMDAIVLVQLDAIVLVRLDAIVLVRRDAIFLERLDAIFLVQLDAIFWVHCYFGGGGTNALHLTSISNYDRCYVYQLEKIHVKVTIKKIVMDMAFFLVLTVPFEMIHVKKL